MRTSDEIRKELELLFEQRLNMQKGLNSDEAALAQLTRKIIALQGEFAAAKNAEPVPNHCIELGHGLQLRTELVCV
ncbi:MAG: hypothetical protein KGJ93_00915 [Patescibacteria group bacterium]|nr:hypothetical protein [Patescibacteria group bacterium]